MTSIKLEHINISVKDAQKTAQRLCDLFDWKVRWEGSSMDGQGFTSHVGSDDFYLAIYAPVSGVEDASISSYGQNGGLNHIGLIVDDLAAMESCIEAAGYKPINHADYEPGKRFYFIDDDGIEFELVSYD